MAELAVSGVELAFGGLQVLQDVSFDARPGELLALIGPNGAGKTSVLNCVSGLYRPQRGSIRFAGRELSAMKPYAIASLGIGRTFQHGDLFPNMSVLDNLLVARHTHIRTNLLLDAFFAGPSKRAEVAHRRRAEEILEFVELERYRHHPVDGLPFGAQKIVGFARALAAEPKVLLLDEPSAGLNREEREDLARFILRIRHELRIAMVWVEHDMQMVADLADRICVLESGTPIATGSAEAVLKDPRVIAAYLGIGS